MASRLDITGLPKTFDVHGDPNTIDVDGAIKDQLVERVRSATLRRKFLEKGDSANLADLLHLASPRTGSAAGS
ncbi:hypothetical protein RRG08_010493 [Elysia crispata]|uniref:Uncharacterized protein n=1 Tax=Elysia crispata TaxID=231223 RepID=A0AAE1ANE7_9GAST|nr:hypothetical protein RRG08_010493 [Elysia crispata]